MELSVVSTLYKSSGTILQFLEETYSVVGKAKLGSFEVVLVDDGSPDDSVDLILKS